MARGNPRSDSCLRSRIIQANVRRTWAPRGQTPIVRHRYQRDKVSAISAVTVSATRHRVGLYLHLHPGENITNVEVAIFLRALLRHLRGQVIVLLDRGSIHKGPAVQALDRRCPRLHLEWFPGYAPELNPDEWVWAHFKAQLANGHPDSVDSRLVSGPARVDSRARASATGASATVSGVVAAGARANFGSWAE